MKEPSTKQLHAAAKARYESEHIHVHTHPDISSDGSVGAWVQAWVWVEFDSIDDEPPATA